MVWLYAGSVSLILPDVRFGMVSLVGSPLPVPMSETSNQRAHSRVLDAKHKVFILILSCSVASVGGN